jgi:putative transcriptional regulator
LFIPIIFPIFAQKLAASMQYNRIKEVLDAKGIKQVWLAYQIGKSFRTVNMYVNNVIQPPIPILYDIAHVLEVKPQELLVNDSVEQETLHKVNTDIR